MASKIETAPETGTATLDQSLRPPLRKRSDVWAGLVCLALGAMVVLIGLDYPLGQSGRIGPGYAPRLLGLLLCGIGLLLALRAFWTSDAVDTTFRPRPVVLVLVSVLAFAIVFAWTGLIPAILVSVFIANWAAAERLGQRRRSWSRIGTLLVGAVRQGAAVADAHLLVLRLTSRG